MTTTLLTTFSFLVVSRTHGSHVCACQQRGGIENIPPPGKRDDARLRTAVVAAGTGRISSPLRGQLVEAATPDAGCK